VGVQLDVVDKVFDALVVRLRNAFHHALEGFPEREVPIQSRLVAFLALLLTVTDCVGLSSQSDLAVEEVFICSSP